ncbi:mechanosensitive ion channel family protein [Carnimonas nigrificans]|uniref:mechanosensitive ion channel family protein n=1 Tax=Carnimonas nigrificans TaxID=64323 RepID=UPI00046FCFEC|nr:mechanosensitive ion channel domain-containing protein [Carnimonas nigrificans]
MNSTLEHDWQMFNSMLPSLLGFAGRLLVALILLAIGWWVINVIMRVLNRIMSARHMEQTLQGFLGNMILLLLRLLLLISTASTVGIATTSFITVLGAMSVAIGLAWKNSLANFAGGVMILMFRPFKSGDYISCGGHEGTVIAIEIFRTILRTTSNDIVYVPNSSLSETALVNNSENGQRLATISLLIDYDDNIDKARSLLLGLIEGDSRVFTEPAPSVSFAPQPVNVAVSICFWCSVADKSSLVSTYSEEAIKLLKKEGYHLGTTSRPAAAPQVVINK